MRAAPALLCLAALALSACWPEDTPQRLSFSGKTMGTSYNITVIDPPKGQDSDSLQALTETVLAEVNGNLNNWDPNSEISRFNSSDGSQPIKMSDDLAAVMAEAMRIHDLSGQRFDVTLAPLINLWGFGPKAPGEPVPSEAEIAAALEAVGQAQKLEIEGASLTKAGPEVTANLSAIAKGYGVDRIGSALQGAGIENFLVEIGGDLLARGLNDEGAAWSIGIERPDAAARTVEVILPISDLGLATSGDYRNYFEADGVRYSHIIDPTTGRPITHSTASVTVLAPSAMEADGLATALLVVGGAEALEIAEAEGLAVMLIERRDGSFVTSTSPAFDALLNSAPE